MGPVTDPAQPKRVGIVCGLASEATVIRRAFEAVGGAPQYELAVSGADAACAEAAATKLTEAGVDALVSAGLCGGLAPQLRIGDLVRCANVTDATTGTHYTANPWRPVATTAKNAPRCHEGTIIGSDEAILTVADKTSAFARTGALAVDMESHALAKVAARARVPFFVLRAVIDDATMALPPFLGRITSPSGHPRHVALAAELIRRPRYLPNVIALARASGRAHRALEAGARQLAAALQEDR
ncbi:MAG: hypothetical protein AAF580_01285 [Pseudomonadota bacterium]